MQSAWLRLGLLGVCLLGAGRARADGDQATDDETPGSRTTARTRRPASEQVLESDTPKAEPPARAPAAADTGDSPVRLDNSGVAREGVYNGVSIGGQNLPPRAPKLPLKKGPQRMTWPGFQVRDGVPTVFLQTTSTPDYAVRESGGAVVVTLKNTTIKLRNNQRPLKVAEFGTAITEISAKPHGHDVIVTIKRKGEGGHRERVEPSAGGFSLLLVELPSK